MSPLSVVSLSAPSPPHLEPFFRKEVAMKQSHLIHIFPLTVKDRIWLLQEICNGSLLLGLIEDSAQSWLTLHVAQDLEG